MLIPLHALFSVNRGDEHPVCHDGERFIRWREFSAKVNALVLGLRQRSEMRWLLSSNDAQNFVIQLLALLHAGKQVVMPPNTQPGTIAQLSHVFDADISEMAFEPSTKMAVLPLLDPQSAIIDLYTSGSTGEPKQVRKTLAQFESEIEVLESVWGNALDSTTITATVPHQHIYGLLFRLLWPLSAGRTFDTVTCTHHGMLCERLALFGTTALISSPAQLSRLPELVPLQALTPTPKLIFSSGGPLPETAAATFKAQLGQAPTEVFGSTETGGIAWRKQDDEDNAWTTFPSISVQRGEDSALLLRSPFLRQSTPWRMDDAIEFLPDGRFSLGGRLDRIVKVEEKRLSLPDLETRLASHAWIANAAAVVLPGRRQSIGAVAILSHEGQKQLAAHGRRTTIQHLKLHLAAHFEAVLLPRRWRFPQQLPFNEQGKLTRAALAALFSPEDYDAAA